MQVVINEYIDLIWYEGQPTIFVAGKKFNQCMFLAATISHREGIEINSIDELMTIDDARIMEDDGTFFGMTPKAIMEAHASNLQAWCENDYDTRILHSNLSFSLLRKLAKEGDKKAKIVLKSEIEERLRTRQKSVIISIIDCCMDFIPAETILDFAMMKDDHIENAITYSEHDIPYIVQKNNTHKYLIIIDYWKDISLGSGNCFNQIS